MQITQLILCTYSKNMLQPGSMVFTSLAIVFNINSVALLDNQIQSAIHNWIFIPIETKQVWLRKYNP